jgi:hypothetical protein
MTLADKLLIVATFTGPILGALAATGLIAAILKLAKTRARRVEHINADGADLYRHGYPLDEAQFRAAYAAYEADRAGISPSDVRANEVNNLWCAKTRSWTLTCRFAVARPLCGIR